MNQSANGCSKLSAFKAGLEAFVFYLAFVSFLPMSCLAGASSSNYAIDHDFLGAGGGRSASSAYEVEASLGAIGGALQSANGQIELWLEHLAILVDPNTVPVPRNLYVQRLSGAGTRIAVSKLTQAAHDPDGDTLALVRFDTVTATGGSVRRESNWLIYQPMEGNNNSDSFAFTIADGQGGQSTGWVFISVWQEEQAQTKNMTRVVVGETEIVVRFVGIPGVEYQIQSTPSLTDPVWGPVATAVAGSNGLFEVRDVRQSDQTRFYRAIFVRP